MRVARITPTTLKGRAGISVRFPYDEHVLEQLKAMVPRRDRWFNPHSKSWFVAARHADLVRHFILEAFPAVEVVDDDGRAVTIEGGDRLIQERLL